MAAKITGTTTGKLSNGTDVDVTGNVETIYDGNLPGGSGTTTLGDGSVITVTAIGIKDVAGNGAQFIYDTSNRSDVIVGNNAGDTIVDKRTGLIGSGTGDVFIGGTGKDTLTDAGTAAVGSYVDEFYGNNGSDTLNGGRGNDILIGGQGGDNLTAGAGKTTFVYYTNTKTAAADSPFAFGGPVATGDVKGWDVITNFTHNKDQLDFNDTGGASVVLSSNGNSPGMSLITAAGRSLVWEGTQADLGSVLLNDQNAGTANAGRAYGVWQDAGHNFVYADITGDGKADLKIQVNGVALTATDFKGVTLHQGPVSGPQAGATVKEDTTLTGGSTLVVKDADGTSSPAA
jgi:Ca2+-binding RTX toxin-like protein